jgi:hypothetical protein
MIAITRGDLRHVELGTVQCPWTLDPQSLGIFQS